MPEVAEAVQVVRLPRTGADARRVFALQREAYARDPYPTYEERRETLTKLERILVENAPAIAEAIAADFGHHSADEVIRYEIHPAVDVIRHTRRHLKKWMRSRSRPVSLLYATGTNRVMLQPRGVVGVIGPWNGPIFCVIIPLASILAAGNRAMVKMATNSQHLCRLLAERCGAVFSEETLTFLPGVPATEFSSLPFDHLMFTGSAEAGRAVMRAAAENLTPVTLELGGKSPAILCDDFDPAVAASRIMFAKMTIAGQVCIATDYVLVPEGKRDAFVAAARRLVSAAYPDTDDESYTAIIDERAYRRLRATLEDAERKGARIVPLIPGASFNDALRKFPPHLVLDVTDEMTLMQEEIFGPLLPVRTYRTLDEALAYVNGRDRPLALYAFTNDRNTERKILSSTISGTVCVNSCGFQLLQADLPFGGTGASGMGHYRGYEGFLEFSHLRPVFRFPRFSQIHRIYPPYTAWQRRFFELLLKYKP